MTQDLQSALIDRAATIMATHAQELTQLDQAIGDGDHGINMTRGFDAIAQQRESLAAVPFNQALQKAGMTLVMKVGGASGPLYGSLLMSMGKAMPETPASLSEVTAAVAEGVAAVQKRGKSGPGEKTMLEVLVPVLQAMQAADGADLPGTLARLRTVADEGLESTRPMRATKGRASYLGERSIGHLDPGARSSALLVHAVADVLEERL